MSEFGRQEGRRTAQLLTASELSAPLQNSDQAKESDYFVPLPWETAKDAQERGNRALAAAQQNQNGTNQASANSEVFARLPWEDEDEARERGERALQDTKRRARKIDRGFRAKRHKNFTRLCALWQSIIKYQH